MTRTMHLTDRPRLAAYEILQTTPLGRSLHSHTSDDGKCLTLAINVDDWESLSSGEQVLLQVIEQLAGQHPTTTLHEIGSRLDTPCRQAVHDALGRLWGVAA